jgi:ribosomal protein S18 acetylase RimI-like enzyme
MNIVTASYSDFEKLEQLASFIWRESYTELLGENQVEYMLGRFQNAAAFSRQISEGYIYRVVYDGDEMIGYTASVLQGERIFLSKLYLKKSYHGQGIGRIMLEDVISLYPEARAIFLTVNKNNPVYEIYRHLGFETIEAVCTDIGEGYFMDDYVMQRNL